MMRYDQVSHLFRKSIFLSHRHTIRNMTDDFRYNGVKPVTKEQVILMICDAVEAASRSLKDYSAESVSALVDRIIDGKAEEGQFSDSEISLRDLNILRETIKSYLMQMYHSRVAYPKRNQRQQPAK